MTGYQETIDMSASENTATPKPHEPPIPKNQSEIQLETPIETLDAITSPDTEIHEWLNYIRQHYQPPNHVDVLLLYPCASEKPMPESKTYQALSETMMEFPEQKRRRIHTVTVSEPMALIPYELQDHETWLYDCPGLFKWWVDDNGKKWSDSAQTRALEELGRAIAGYLSRAKRNSWYDRKLACVRRMSAEGNESKSQTHRRMLETATSISNTELEWLPSRDVITSLTEEVGPMAWQMAGVSHPAPQTELSEKLEEVIQE